MEVLPGDLTLGDVHASLGHEAHAPLWLLAAEGVEVVNVGGLLCDLKVPDTAVPLHTHTHTHTHLIVQHYLYLNRRPKVGAVYTGSQIILGNFF